MQRILIFIIVQPKNNATKIYMQFIVRYKNKLTKVKKSNSMVRKLQRLYQFSIIIIFNAFIILHILWDKILLIMWSSACFILSCRCCRLMSSTFKITIILLNNVYILFNPQQQKCKKKQTSSIVKQVSSHFSQENNRNDKFFMNSNIIYLLFPMHFCSEQDLTRRAQCCLIKHTSLLQDGNRLTQDGLIGIQNSKTNPKVNTVKSKNQASKIKNKSYLSQQKERIRLSKYASKNSARNQDKLFTKQPVSNTRDSRMLIAQPKVEQNLPNNRNLSLNFSFGQFGYQKGKGTTSARIKNHAQQNPQLLQTPLQKNYQYIKAADNRTIQHFQKPMTVNPLSYREYKKVSFNYTSPPVHNKPVVSNINPVNHKNAVTNNYTTHIRNNTTTLQSANIVKPPLPIQELTLVQSVHQKSHLHSNTNQLSSGININIKGVQTLAPTIQTDRNLVYSQAKDENQNKKSNTKLNNSQVLMGQSSKYAESRLTQTVNPDIGRKQLKTVQSFYGSELSANENNINKQVLQSVILIDFFNPSEHMRKQIEQKIRNKHSNFSQFYS